MSKVNGEKARAAIQKKNRTAMREKSRVRHAELKKAGQEKSDGK
jgi:hypothetical protein